MNREELESLKQDLEAFDPNGISPSVQHVLGMVESAISRELEREEERAQYLDGFESGSAGVTGPSDAHMAALSRDCGRSLK